ncbi:MAG: 50S ribosomal protein L3 N(5)-glutamine methyltransferase [Gammaproteobacteria bacterium]|nr:50S ribosomal protein L3 N(5)-glutamine methyltransferase [Gammaproteobacteria bacterium]
MNLDNQNLTQVSQELTTLRDYIRWGYSRFNAANLYYGHGTDNSWDEAVHLILSALHLPPDISPDLMSSTLTLVERRNLCELIFRRIDERIPAAYLTKEAWFAGLPFHVDERVIIPRSPLGELIEKGFSPWLDNHTPHHILDLCTGSGCIAIACAVEFAESQIDAVDISADALDVAKSNVVRHNLESQVNLIQSDLYQNVKGKYDLIISNPPYVSHQEYDALPQEYSHEPSLALKANDDGLELAKRILKNAGEHLYSEGVLIVEVGNSQEALMENYPEVPFLWLDFERGGDGVFLLTAEQVKQYQSQFDKN